MATDDQSGGLAPGKTLAQRYLVWERLGGGHTAHTFTALDIVRDEVVVVKELALRGMEDWKPFDLFEREARALAGLDHPRIPRLVEHFQVEEGRDLYLYLIMTRAGGRSLSALMADGWHPTEAEAIGVARDALELLQYLHGLNPPLVHRDLKPSNLIRDDDGRLHLVDFGGVQDLIRPKGGSTVIGTFGYMAPEQFAGRAVPGSDLYGLGATLVHLLSGVPPAQIPQRELRLDFRPLVACSDALAEWVERLLEPTPEHRFASAATAALALEALAPGNLPLGLPGNNFPVAVSRPTGTRVLLRRHGGNLHIEVPGRNQGLLHVMGLLLAIPLAYAACMLLLLEPSLWSALLGILGMVVLLGLVLGAVLLQEHGHRLDRLFEGFGAADLGIFPVVPPVAIDLSLTTFMVRRQAGRLIWGRERSLKALHRVAIEPLMRGKSAYTRIVLHEASRRHAFGIALTPAEQEWLATEIRNHLEYAGMRDAAARSFRSACDRGAGNYD